MAYEQYWIPLLSAVIASIITVIVAPYVNWGIEKKRLKQNNRKDFLARCRAYIENPNFENKKFVNSSFYSQLKPNLSLDLINKFEKDENHVTIKQGIRGGVDNFKPNLLDEIKDLEIKWNLL
ncbi:MAG: hypothetical protein AB7V77_01645 [Candidatus Woesearchaeota archaeon]